MPDVALWLVEKYEAAIVAAMQSQRHKSVLHELAMLDHPFCDEERQIVK